MSETEYKTVRGLMRGLALINGLNRFDGGASTAQLAEQSGLHRPRFAGCWRPCRPRVMCAAASRMTAIA